MTLATYTLSKKKQTTEPTLMKFLWEPILLNKKNNPVDI